jgi:hypothetical protein
VKYIKSIYAVVLCLFLSLVIFTCKKKDKEIIPVNYGYNYFPEKVGQYAIYEVDSIAQDDASNKHDTTRYLLKELIAESFLDNSGRPAYRMERYYKYYRKNIPYDSMNWQGPRVWYANSTISTAEKVEENVRYIKLTFPVSKGKKWDGNAYNTLGQKQYEVTSVDVPETINGVHFDSVITIKQFEQVDFIEYIYQEEKYARNIGLVYKVQDSLLYNGGAADTTGYTYTQQIITYGP